MAQQVFLDRENLSCSICLDLLKDPVTIPCGHSYCMSCIKDCWDEEHGENEIYSCPQCRQSFIPRPGLVKSTLLAELVEEQKKVGLHAVSPDQSFAGPEDVACDFCSGIKVKAFKSCLVCMASYCEQHLQPHYNVAVLKKHKLVEATSKLEENICSRHNEVMKIFCRTDQQCICYLCLMDDHKGHDTVSAAAERAERQTELGVSRQRIQQRVQDREKDAKVLQQRVEAINLSADEAVKDSEKIFTDLIRLIERRSSEVKQQIRSQQKTQDVTAAVSKARDKLQAVLRPEDVACDFCSGIKVKALKSCLVCMASYCEQHLQPHYNVAVLKKHKLVEAILKLEKNICSRHDEVMKIFCRTDQQCICYLCLMDDHKGHDTVSAAAERAERQTELGVSRQRIQQRVQVREKDVKVLQQRVEAINLSADEAVRDSEKIFTDLIRLIEKRSSEVKQQIRSQQKTQDVTAAVSKARDKLQAVLSEEWTKISLAVTEVDVALPQAEPRTRAEFMRCSHQITLDPNTAHRRLSLSDRNRKICQLEDGCKHHVIKCKS
ncbi:hypothetical protein ABVT39_017261 [Epinephelus coioides]